MPGPTYGKRLGKKTNRKQKKSRKALGYGKGGAFGDGRLSTQRRKERSGKGAYSYVGTYKGSGKDAAKGVSKAKRQRRSAKSIYKATQLKRQRDLVSGKSSPAPISSRGYEARYGIDTEKTERKEIQRYKKEKTLVGRGKNLRAILGPTTTPQQLSYRAKFAKDIKTYKIRDAEITRLEDSVKSYDKLIKKEEERKKNVITDKELTDYFEAGIFSSAQNVPEEIVKNKNARLTYIRARRAEDRAELERLLTRRARGRVTKFSRRLVDVPRTNPEKQKRLSEKIDRFEKEAKWRSNTNKPRLEKKREERLKDEARLNLSKTVVTYRKRLDQELRDFFETAIKVSDGKTKRDLIDAYGLIKVNKHPSPPTVLMAASKALNDSIGGGMRTNKVHPLVTKLNKTTNELIGYEEAAKSYGLNFAEQFLSSPAQTGLIAIDLVSLGGVFKTPLKAGGKLALKLTGARALGRGVRAVSKATARGVKNRSERLAIREGLAKSGLSGRRGGKVKSEVGKTNKIVDPDKITPKATGQAAAKNEKVADEIIRSAATDDIKTAADAAIDAQRAGKMGNISDELANKIDELAKYQDEVARRVSENPRAAGAMSRKLNRLREDLATQLLKEEQFARRGLQAPLKNTRYMLDEAGALSQTSLKRLGARYKWPLRLGVSGVITSASVDEVVTGGEITNNFLINAKDLASSVPYALVETGKMVGDVVLNQDTDRVSAFWDYMVNHDAVFLAFQGRWDEAKKSAKERPLDALLMIGGVYGAVGRGIGTAARGAGRFARVDYTKLPDGNYRLADGTISNKKPERGYNATRNPEELKDQLNQAKSTTSRNLMRIGHVGSQLRRPLPLVFDDSPQLINRRLSPNIITAQAQKFVDNRSLAKIKAIQAKADDGISLTKQEEKKLLAHQLEVENNANALYRDLIDHTWARLNLTNRAEVSKIESAINDIANDLTKSPARGGLGKDAHLALRPLASGEFGGPAQVVANLEKALADVKKWRKNWLKKESYNQSSPFYRAAGETQKLFEKLLEKPEILTDPKMWEAVNKLGDVINPLEDALVRQGLLLPQQRDFAPLVPYAVRVMGAKSIKAKNGQIRFYIDKKSAKSATGEMGERNFLTPEDIRAHMRANGFENDPIFFSSLPTVLPDSNTTHAATLNSLGKTYNASTAGDLIARFGHDLSFENVKRSAISVKLNLNKQKIEEFILQRTLVGDTNGKLFKTAAEAEKFYRDNPGRFPVEMELWAVDVTSDAIKLGETINKASDLDHTSPIITDLNEYLRTDAANVDYLGLQQSRMKALKDFKNSNSEATYGVRVGLIPKAVANRLRSHAKVDSFIAENGGGRFFNTLTREFKASVLPFSIAWHTGNMVDMALRMLFDGVNPIDYATGLKLRKHLKENYPEVYDAVLIEMGGGHLISAKSSLVRGSRKDGGFFQENKPIGALSSPRPKRFGSSAKLQPYERRMLDASEKILYQIRPDQQLFRRYKDAAEFGFRFGEFIEERVRFATLGKYGRQQLTDLGTSWFKHARLTNEAIEKLAFNLMDENLLKQVAKSTNKVLGDYTNMSPRLRGLVRTVVPFGLWLRASATWLVTLPYNYPVKSAFVAGMAGLTEEERRSFGLSVFGNNVVPNYLLGAIPASALPDKLIPGKQYEIDPISGERQEVYLRTSNYTSFGPYYDLGDLANFVFPWWNSLFNVAASGIDWTGSVMRKPNGEKLSDNERVGLALYGLMETYFYPMSYIHSLQLGGRPSTTSTPWSPRRDYRFYGPQNTPGEIVIWEKYFGKSWDLINPSNRQGLGARFFNPFRGIPYKPTTKPEKNRGISSYTSRALGSSNLLGQTKKRVSGREWRYIDPEQNKKSKQKDDPFDNYR